MYIHLDLGWQQHPFPFNSFKLRSDDQITTLRSLGLGQVRYSPRRSDVGPLPLVDSNALADAPPSAPGAPAPTPPASGRPQDVLRERLVQQQAALYRCETRFLDASRRFKQLQQRVRQDPDDAREAAEQMVESMAADVEGDHEVTIRLLSERVGDETSTHPVNVSVLSLLLARACELPAATVRDAAISGLLHDVGKLDLPGFLHWSGAHLNEHEQRAAQKHVELGVEAGKRMGLGRVVLRAIAEHHERSDGSGYPMGIKGEGISPLGRIVGLVNHYENLVNPGNAVQGMTPHEALAMIFAKQRGTFDSRILGLFVRMMGIYPPGSIVELVDRRLALVVSATPDVPLRPRVVVLDGSSSLDEALIIDINADPRLGIHKSLRPEQVPRDAFAYLSLRRRSCYYFESIEDLPPLGDAPAA